MQFKLCDDPWGEEELNAIRRVMDSGMYTMGQNVRAYEEQFAHKFGTKHAVMVSSGLFQAPSAGGRSNRSGCFLEHHLCAAGTVWDEACVCGYRRGYAEHGCSSIA